MDDPVSNMRTINQDSTSTSTGPPKHLVVWLGGDKTSGNGLVLESSLARRAKAIVFFAPVACEHLRLAESEELGALLQAKMVKEDLVRLIVGMEEEDDTVFADATGEPREDGGETGNHGSKRDPPDDMVPLRRMKQKGWTPMVPQHTIRGFGPPPDGDQDLPMVPEDDELLCYMASDKRSTKS